MSRRSRARKHRMQRQMLREDAAASNGETRAGAPTMLMRWLHPRIVAVVLAAIAVGYKKLWSDGDNRQAPPSLNYRSFLAGPGIPVYVVKDFLPLHIATQWRNGMAAEWHQQQQQQNQSTNTSWLYATNNDGSSPNSLHFSNNKKTRGMMNIAERNETAHKMYQNNAFSYSKWELSPTHDLVRDITKTLLSEDITTRVKSVITNGDLVNAPQFQPTLSDLFVTYYGTFDFLSRHDDSVSGTWAIVVSLLDGPANQTWPNNNDDDEDFGGQTRFQCDYGADNKRPPPILKWCESIPPAFNTALLFRTRPRGPNHDVAPVSWKAAHNAFYRFGLTGWYMELSDEMNDYARAERDKMRARTTTD